MNFYQRPSESVTRFYCIVGFLVGFLAHFKFFVIGKVTGAEAIAVFLLPVWFVLRDKSLNLGKSAVTLTLIGLYFASSLVSNFSAGNDFFLGLRGIAKPVFIGSYILFFMFVVPKVPKMLVYFILGLSLSPTWNLLIPPDKVDLEEAAAGGISAEYANFTFLWYPMIQGYSSIVFYVLYRWNRLVGAIFDFSIVLPILGQLPRSVLGTQFLQFCYYSLIWLSKGSSTRAVRLSNFQLGSIVAVGVVSGIGVLYLYTYAAPRGWLGDRQMEKFEDQSQTIYGGTPLGIVLAGRLDSYALALGVFEGPFVGAGAWNPTAYAPHFIQAAADLGTELSDDQMTAIFFRASGGHSILFGEWFFQGIGGGLFFLYVGMTYVRLSFYFFRKDNLLTPLLGAGAIVFLWHLLFSPLSTQSRLVAGLVVAMFNLLRYHPGFERRVLAEFHLSRPWKQIFSFKSAY